LKAGGEGRTLAQWRKRTLGGGVSGVVSHELIGLSRCGKKKRKFGQRGSGKSGRSLWQKMIDHLQPRTLRKEKEYLNNNDE